MSADADPRDRRAEMRGSIVPECLDQRMPLEGGLHDPSLHTAPAAVNEPHFPQARGGGRLDVVVDDAWNVARRKRVQIELPLDGHTNGLIVKVPHRLP